MAFTTTRFPTTDTVVSGTWTNPTNVQSDNGAVASTTLAVKNTTVERQQGGYGFDSALPASAVITSVAIEVEHRVSTNGSIATLRNYARISTTAGANNDNSAEPTTLTVQTFSAYGRPGGGSWTRADLLDATFTTRIAAVQGNSATSCTYEWDYISVTVVYEVLPPGLGTIVGMDMASAAAAGGAILRY